MTEFLPAMWLRARGFSIDDATIALDKLQDDGASNQMIHMMMDCLDEALFFRVIGVYQQFPWHRLSLACADNRVANFSEDVKKLAGTIKTALGVVRPFTTRTPLTDTRIKRLDQAMECGKGAVAATCCVITRSKNPFTRYEMQRLACRLDEGFRQLEVYHSFLLVRKRYGMAAGKSIEQQAHTTGKPLVEILTDEDEKDWASNLVDFMRGVTPNPYDG